MQESVSMSDWVSDWSDTPGRIHIVKNGSQSDTAASFDKQQSPEIHLRVPD